MTPQSRVVVVIAGGDAPDGAPIPAGATVIAADSGIDHARALGLHIDLAVGDFDSVSDAGREWVRASGTPTEQHPVEKNATDLELALDAALALEPGRISVIGAGGGRLDHLLANLLLLGAPRFAPVAIDAYVDRSHVSVIHGERTLVGRRGDIVTLLALHGAAHGVTTAGLAYGLREATLDSASTIGVSNALTETKAHVALRSGVLLAIQPGDSE